MAISGVLSPHILWVFFCLTLLHSGRPKLHTVLAFLSAIGLTQKVCTGIPNIHMRCMTLLQSERIHFQGKQICHLHICLPLKAIEVSSRRSKFFPVRADHFVRAMLFREANMKSRKLSPFANMTKK